MENNFDNIPENQKPEEQNQAMAGESIWNQDASVEAQKYTDPNAGVNSGYNTNYQQSGQTYGNTNYQQSNQAYGNTNYQQQYQDNYNYNVGNNTGYNQDYQNSTDTAPMSMGEWVLTLLLMSIPCVNIILCCVWAFGKNGNVNRRNFCRAELIFIGIGTVVGIIMSIVIMTAAIGSGGYYYY